MNTKELISTLAQTNSMTEQEASQMLGLVVNQMVDTLTDGKVLSVKGFGAFEVRKKNERMAVHPTTGAKMMVPPKLVLAFKQSTVLKDKLKEKV